MGGGQSSDSKKLTKNTLDQFDRPLDDSSNVRESKYPLKEFSRKILYIQLNENKNMTIEVTTAGLTVDWLYQHFLQKVWHFDKTFDRKSKILKENKFLTWILDFVCLKTLFENTVLDFLMTQRDNFIDDIPNQCILQPVLKPDKTFTKFGKRFDDPHQMSSYEILQVIGKGGFSKVYLVRMKINGKIYAMKVISKKYASKWGGELVKREFQLMKEVDHPLIIDLVYVFPTADTYVFVMEFAPGNSLYHNLVMQRKFTIKNSLIYFAEMLSVVRYMHFKGILFRDLKVSFV